MSVTRWKEEIALREKLKSEKEEEERYRQEKKKERLENKGKAKKKKDLLGYLTRQKNKLKRQANVLKGEKEGWELKAKEGDFDEVKSGIARLKEIENDICLVMAEVEMEETESVVQWRQEMTELQAAILETKNIAAQLLETKTSEKINDANPNDSSSEHITAAECGSEIIVGSDVAMTDANTTPHSEVYIPSFLITDDDKTSS